ncbi:MAG: PrsW family glutamic-type intramembrane protease [Clostridia bacterium]|nr:PrsW family glutamic-type intramembrane protease [Clostridia bacterium]
MLYLFEQYAFLLIGAAVIPAVLLVRAIYKADSLEKEPSDLIVRLLIGGVISTIIATVLERVGLFVLDGINFEDSTKYYMFQFFVIVGPAEEISKYILLRKMTWNHPSFNCQFDAIVYATVTSLGFALWENIKYVFSYGLGTALVRAVTAVPGHACFGVFMGVWYGVAKRQEVIGNHNASVIFRIIAIISPMIVHGAYDYIATISSDMGTLLFFAFVVIMFFIAIRVVKRLAAHDRYLDSKESL